MKSNPYFLIQKHLERFLLVLFILFNIQLQHASYLGRSSSERGWLDIGMGSLRGWRSHCPWRCLRKYGLWQWVPQHYWGDGVQSKSRVEIFSKLIDSMRCYAFLIWDIAQTRTTRTETFSESETKEQKNIILQRRRWNVAEGVLLPTL